MGGGCCVMNNPVGDFFRGVGEVAKEFFGIDSGGGYYPGVSDTEAHAKKINDELAEMKEKIRETSEKKEKECIDYINKSMNDLIELLEKVNKQKFGGKSLKINIDGIRAQNEELKKEVKGYIGNIMDDRLVTKDAELSVILEERDDEKRGKNFDAFCKRVQKQALRGLSEKIETTVRKQEDMIQKEIEMRLKEVDENMQTAMSAYIDIVNLKEQDEAKLEETRIKYIYQYELSEILLDQLGG